MAATIVDRYGYPYKFAHAAQQDITRGVYYPVRTADIDKLINPSDLKTLRSLSGRLYTNMGVPKACLQQIADYSVGEAWLPTYTGASDFADGKLVANRLRSLWFPNCEVRGGCYDWHKMLELTSIAMDRDGDAFWLMIAGDDGFPRIQIIPANRVGDGDSTGKVKGGKWDGYKIHDGVITYSSGRPAAYRILTGEDMDGFVDVEAASVIHFFDPEHAGQTRGIPKFAHAIQDLAACVASTQDERTRMQIISRLYLTVFNELGGPNLDDPKVGMQAGDASDGTGDITFHDIPGGITYARAGSGEKMEQVRHENPGDIWESMNNRLIRMALVGAGWSYSLWIPTGQGTAERGEIVKMRRTISRRQKQLRYGATRAMAWAYSVFQKAGKMPLLDHPFSWSFSKPPRLSVDDGRESKMELEEWRAGVRNTDEILEARGMTTDEFDERRARIIGNRKVTARRVAEEISAASGYEIEIEDREMAMLTPNEVAETDAPDMPESPDKSKPTKPDEDSED